MTWRELLKTLKEMAQEDVALDDSVSTADILDYLGILGFELASEAHMAVVRKGQQRCEQERSKEAI